jgi:hypothetical protein
MNLIRMLESVFLCGVMAGIVRVKVVNKNNNYQQLKTLELWDLSTI